MGLIGFNPFMGNQNIPPANRIFNFQKPYLAMVYFAPRKFRPKSDAKVCANHIFNCRRTITFKNNIRLKPCMMAEFIAYAPKLFGSEKADKTFVLHLFQINGFSASVFRGIGYGKEYFLRTDKPIRGRCAAAVKKICGDFNIKQFILRILQNVKIDVRMQLFIRNNCLGNNRRCCQNR